MNKYKKRKQFFNETVKNITLPGWAITYKTSSIIQDKESFAESHSKPQYRSCVIYFSYSLDELIDALDKEPFATRLGVIHEAVHTWFKVYKDAIDDLELDIAPNVLSRIKNRILYNEEQHVEMLAIKMYKLYRPKEFNKYKKEYGL